MIGALSSEAERAKTRKFGIEGLLREPRCLDLDPLAAGIARLDHGLERTLLRPFRGRHRLAIEMDVEEDGARGFARLAERGEHEWAVCGVVE